MSASRKKKEPLLRFFLRELRSDRRTLTHLVFAIVTVLP